MGTLAVTNPSSGNNNVISMSGRMRLLVGTFTFSSSYTTGGEAFDLVTQFPGLVKTVFFIDTSPMGGNTFQWDATNKKLIAYAGASQVSAATNLSTLGAVPFFAVVR